MYSNALRRITSLINFFFHKTVFMFKQNKAIKSLLRNDNKRSTRSDINVRC